ncbi:MAG: hypothetical protein BRD28_05700 [Bacteroidetes bacterium QH_10_64_37]|nr:MAG: hypothetical protein BRD28_05700 [Bacteroidetes bacterium QH_10_64_37]
MFPVHRHEGLLSANQSLEFSALVLFLLVLVCAFGSGRWSPDAQWRRASVASESPRRRNSHETTRTDAMAFLGEGTFGILGRRLSGNPSGPEERGQSAPT